MYQNRVLKGILAPIILISLSQSAFAVGESSELVSTNKITKSKTKKKLKSEKHTLSGSAEIGLGYDSNAFQAPDKSYNDYTSSGGGALINPTVKSGMFIPYALKGAYEYRLKQNTRLIGDVRLSGKYFYDSDLKNANEYKIQARAGVRLRFNKYKKEINHVEIKAVAGKVHEIYVDHDDGSLKTTVGGDQSNRYKYQKVGAELTYKYDFRKIDILFNATYEDRNYETPSSWSSLDHKYSKYKVQAGYQLTKALHLGAYYQYSLRDYKERKSYKIASNGIISLVNPGVNYTYNNLKLFGDYDFTKSYNMDLEYLVSDRKDDNQGYSDYLYHSLSWSNSYKISKALKTFLKLKYYIYDYKNAYAYDTNTAQNKKEADGYICDFNTKYRFSKEWIANLNINYRQENNTDKRYEFNRLVSMLSVKYKF